MSDLKNKGIAIFLLVSMLAMVSGCGRAEIKETVQIDDTANEMKEDGGSLLDYDLTQMSSSMVFGMISQMMMEPNSYIGKSFRMEGTYAPMIDEETGNRYDYCYIQDAASCCAQGMEFVLAEEESEEILNTLKENDSIIVEGVFETYQEENDDSLYCRLKDVSVKTVNHQ